MTKQLSSPLVVRSPSCRRRQFCRSDRHSSAILALQSPIIPFKILLITYFTVIMPSFASGEETTTDPGVALPRMRLPMYLPWDDLDQILNTQPRGIMLPRTEFYKLLKHAHAQTIPGITDKVQHFLNRAVYTVRLEDSQITVKVNARLRQLRPGWQAYEIPIGNLSLESIRLDGFDATLGNDANGKLWLLTSQVGEHAFELELSGPATRRGSIYQTNFPLLTCAQAELHTACPPHTVLTVDSTLLPRDRTWEEPVDYRIPVGGKKHISLTWSQRGVHGQALNLMLVNSSIKIDLQPGAMEWRAELDVHTVGEAPAAINLLLPSNMELAEVRAPGMESWTWEDAHLPHAGTRVKIHFLGESAHNKRISLSGVSSLPSGQPWNVPHLLVENATLHTGTLLIQHSSSQRLEVISLKGVRQLPRIMSADQSTAQSDHLIDDHVQHRFEYWDEEFALQLRLTPRTRQINAGIAGLLSVTAEGAQADVALQILPLFEPLFELHVQLPITWSLVATTSSDRNLLFEQNSQTASHNEWRIVFHQALPTGVVTPLNLKLKSHPDDWPPGDDSSTIDLPEVAIEQARLSETTWVVQGDSLFEIYLATSQGLDVLPLKSSAERLRLQAQDTRYQAQIKVQRRRPHWNVEWLTSVSWTTDSLLLAWGANLSIPVGSLAEIDVAVLLPEELPQLESLRFVSSPIRLREQHYLGFKQGEARWRLVFHTEASGQIALQAQLPLSTTREEPVIMPMFWLPQAEQQSGIVALLTTSDQELTIETADQLQQPLELLDPLDVPSTPFPFGKMVAAYRIVAPNSIVKASRQRYPSHPLASAICPMMTSRVILPAAGPAMYHWEIPLRATSVQKLEFSFDTPVDLWSVTLQDQPIEVRRGNTGWWINLPSSPKSQEYLIQVYLKGPGLDSQRLMWSAPKLRLDVLAADGSLKPVDIVRQRWIVHHPPERPLIEALGTWDISAHTFVPLWWQDLMQWFSSNDWVATPSPERVIQSFFLLGVALLLLTLGTALCGRSRFRWSRLSWILIGMLVVVLGGAGLSLLLLGGRSIPSIAVDHATQADHLTTSSDYFGISTEAFTAAPAAKSLLSNSGGLMQHYDGHTQMYDALGKDTNGMLGGLGGGDTPEAASTPPSPQLEQAARDYRNAEAEFLSESPTQSLSLDNQPAREPPMSTGQGLLSLPIVLLSSDHLTGWHVSRFESHADALQETQPLEVRWMDVSRHTSFRLLSIISGWILGWMTRRLVRQKHRWVAILVTVTLVPLPFLPVALLVWWDLLTLIALAGIAIWVAHGWSSVFFSVRDRLSQRTVGGLSCLRQQHLAGLVWASLAVSLTTTAASYGQDANASFPQPQPKLAATNSWPNMLKELHPYDLSKLPLAADYVWLSEEEFRTLLRLAYPQNERPPIIKSNWGIIQAMYEGTLSTSEGHAPAFLKVRGRLMIHAHEQNTVVHLPFRDVAVEAIRLNGQPAAIAVAESQWQLPVPQPGTHICEVVWQQPIEGTSDAGKLRLELSSVPAGRFSFRLPSAQLSTTLIGSSAGFRRVSRDDATWIDFPINHGGTYQLSWHPQRDHQGDAVQVFTESSQRVELRDAGLSIQQSYRLTVRHGVLREIDLALPTELLLRDIQGSDIAGWEIRDQASERKLTVYFQREITDRTELIIQALTLQSMAVADGTLRIPSMAPLYSTVELGTLILSSPPHIGFQIVSHAGLLQREGTDFLSESSASHDEQTTIVFRFHTRPWELMLKVKRLTPRVSGRLEHASQIEKHKVYHSVRAVLIPERLPVEVGEFILPNDWILLDAHSSDVRDWIVERMDDGSQRVWIWLHQATTSPITIILTAVASRTPAQAVHEIAPVDLPTATSIEYQLVIGHAPALQLEIQNAQGWHPLDPQHLDADSRQLWPSPPRFAFRRHLAPATKVVLRIAETIPYLQSAGLTIVSITDVAVMYGFLWRWHIVGGSTERLQIETSSWLKDRLTFHTDLLREVATLDTPRGTIVWTLFFKRPITDTLSLHASAHFPALTDSLTLPETRFLSLTDLQPLTEQSQYGLLLNLSRGYLQSTTLVNTLPPSQIPFALPPRIMHQVTEAWKFLPGDPLPSWSYHKIPPVPLAAAVIRLADHATAVARDGSYRTRVVYHLRNLGRQFLALVPQDSWRLLSVYVQDQPSRAMQQMHEGKQLWLIPLPQTSEADLSTHVTLTYAGKLAQPLPTAKSPTFVEVQLTAPTVLEHHEHWGIPVLQTRWMISFPEDCRWWTYGNANSHNMSLLDQQTDPLATIWIQDLELLSETLSKTRMGPKQQRAHQNALILQEQIEGRLRSNYSATQDGSRGTLGDWQSSWNRSRTILDSIDQREIFPQDPQQQWAEAQRQWQEIVESNQQTPKQASVDGLVAKFGYIHLRDEASVAATAAHADEAIQSRISGNQRGLLRQRNVQLLEELETKRQQAEIHQNLKAHHHSEKADKQQVSAGTELREMDRSPPSERLLADHDADNKVSERSKTDQAAVHPTAPMSSEMPLGLSLDYPLTMTDNSQTYIKSGSQARLHLIVTTHRAWILPLKVMWGVSWLCFMGWLWRGRLTFLPFCPRLSGIVGIAVLAAGLMGVFYLKPPWVFMAWFVVIITMTLLLRAYVCNRPT